MHIITAGLYFDPSRFAGPPLCGVQRFKIQSCCCIQSALFRLFSRKETFLDKVLGDLDGVGGGAFAEVIGNAPEVEPVFY